MGKHAGVLSFGYFSLDKQRKVTRPWGAKNKAKIEKENKKENTKNFTINPGGKLQIEFNGQVDKKNFMPTPELIIHIEADNLTSNITVQRPYQQ